MRRVEHGGAAGIAHYDRYHVAIRRDAVTHRVAEKLRQHGVAAAGPRGRSGRAGRWWEYSVALGGRSRLPPDSVAVGHLAVSATGECQYRRSHRAAGCDRE